MIVRRKCFNWSGNWTDESGRKYRKGNAIQAATGTWGPKTETQVNINGRWMPESKVDEYLRKRDSYQRGSTAAEAHDLNKPEDFVPETGALREHLDKEAASREARNNNDVPSVIAPGKEGEYLVDERERAAEKAAKSAANKKAALIAGGVAAVGAGGYAAYKAWKKKQAKKKAAAAEAESKFKK